MVLTGTFVRSVDDKLRIAIPKRFRDALALVPNQGLFVTPGIDGSLAMYSELALAAMAGRMAAASPAQQDVRAFSRLFYARAQQVELDAQGRIRIPPALAALAALGKEAVLLGVQDHLELWDRQRWEQYLEAKSSHFDEIAENAFKTNV